MRHLDARHRPEEYVRRRFVQRISEVVQVDVVVRRVQRMPDERRVADGHGLFVAGDDGELVREVLFSNRRAHRAFGELPRHLDRLEHQPALQESGGIRRLRRR